MELERPETPLGLKLAVWGIGGFLALLAVRWVWGIVTAGIQLGLIVLVLAGVIFVISRLSEKG